MPRRVPLFCKLFTIFGVFIVIVISTESTLNYILNNLLQVGGSKDVIVHDHKIAPVSILLDNILTTVGILEASQPVKPSPKPILPPEPTNTEPKAGSKTVIYGKPYLWFPGFGWVEDEGGGSIGTTVGSPGDQLTGHKVGIME